MIYIFGSLYEKLKIKAVCDFQICIDKKSDELNKCRNSLKYKECLKTTIID
jgi:hypothetical protein